MEWCCRIRLECKVRARRQVTVHASRWLRNWPSLAQRVNEACAIPRSKAAPRTRSDTRLAARGCHRRGMRRIFGHNPSCEETYG
jgi:hypothetical protein